jgi:uncharacterized protein (TIGR03435 family)
MCYEHNMRGSRGPDRVPLVARELIVSLLAAVLVVSGLTAARAQQPAPTFDVASVRPGSPGAPGGELLFSDGGRFSAQNETVVELIRAAWNIDTYRIVGGPDWIRGERFTIEARPASAVAIGESRLMLQTLLADRFKLRATTAVREAPVYRLVPNRRDGRLGPQFRPAVPDMCADGQAARTKFLRCGMIGSNPGRMSGRSTSLSTLVAQLSTLTQRVVVDATGLVGLYDLDMEWALTEAEVAEQLALGRTKARIDPDKPSLSGALEAQLGLRLETEPGPVEVLVVESIARPTEN